MNSLKIVQIGDIHFPDAGPLVDAKDPGMSPHVINAVAAHPLQNMMRSVVSVCRNDASVAGVFLCGDLTSGGDLNGYKDCVAYLRRAIGTACPAVWNPTNIHVVPGNHDVDRSLVDPTGADLFQKFVPLQDAWDDAGDPVLAVTSLRRTTVNVRSAKAELFSLNSCLGCGEKRYLPDELSKFPELLTRLNRSITPARIFELLGEQLDTPAFAEEHMSDLVDRISRLPSDRAPLVTAHHNILPQALLRVAIYTEVLNSGLVRSRLGQCGRKIIYCHGHIHDGPIEIVTTPTDPQGGVIVVSTPEFADGFNVLEIQYGLRGIPLGLIVHQYRIRPDGSVAALSGGPLRIRLISSSDMNICSPDRMTGILHALDHDTFLKWPDALEAARGVLGVLIRPQTLADILLDAEWLGGLEIVNRERDVTEWHIRRLLA